jgi:hypothetical protein
MYVYLGLQRKGEDDRHRAGEGEPLTSRVQPSIDPAKLCRISARAVVQCLPGRRWVRVYTALLEGGAYFGDPKRCVGCAHDLRGRRADKLPTRR